MIDPPNRASPLSPGGQVFEDAQAGVHGPSVAMQLLVACSGSATGTGGRTRRLSLQLRLHPQIRPIERMPMHSGLAWNVGIERGGGTAMFAGSSRMSDGRSRSPSVILASLRHQLGQEASRAGCERLDATGGASCVGWRVQLHNASGARLRDVTTVARVRRTLGLVRLSSVRR